MTTFTQGVEAAAAELRALFPETPLQENPYLSRKFGAHIFLKREDLTPVRSYKIRGAFNFFRKALVMGTVAELFVCSSAGNHAHVFAYFCHPYGTRVSTILTRHTPTL